MLGKKPTAESVKSESNGTAVPPPTGYGVRGMTSVDADAIRKDTAPTPKSLGPRD